MGFFERFFKSKKEKPDSKPQPEPKEQSELIEEELEEETTFPEIIESEGKLYFEVNQEMEEKVKKIYNEFKENIDIPTIIRQKLKIEEDPEKKVLRLTVEIGNFSNIEGFKEESKKMLKKIKKQLEKEK